MSTNKTSNYSLNQWVKSDQVRMEDFNADNAKIDAALRSHDTALAGKASVSTLNSLSSRVDGLSSTVSGHTGTLSHKGNCQIELSSYTGNGAKTRTHTFARRPLLVVILSDISILAVQGCPCAIHTLGGGNTYIPDVSWSGNSVTFSATDPGTSDIARVVANTSGRTYYMVALFDVSA